jgi:uncharacterized protein DUF4861
MEWNKTELTMKKKIQIFLSVLLFLSTAYAQDESAIQLFKEIRLTVTNPSDIERADELIKIEVDKLISIHGKFKKDAFVVYEGEDEIPSQLYNHENEHQILFTSDFHSEESKSFSIKYLENGKIRNDYKPRTYAELAMKFDAEFNGKKYIGENFINMTQVVVPKIRSDHDALFKYEGPGWESDKVGYRFYLDWRNAIDIFGKKVSDLILYKVGLKDNGSANDSYHEMQDWGMDIFKVGSSLGIGSIGMMNDYKIEMVSKTDNVICGISANGPVVSTVSTNYQGWKVGEQKYDLISNMSIAAGSRLTNVDLNITNDPPNITTGLAKYENTDFISSESDGDWQYIALYGKQSLAGDNLGIVLFYDKNDLIKKGEDKLNYFISLKHNKGNINYYFAAAWEGELNGIKNKIEFEKFINDELIKMNNPLKLEIN